jgi:bacillithiol system protein YtxJ
MRLSENSINKFALRKEKVIRLLKNLARRPYVKGSFRFFHWYSLFREEFLMKELNTVDQFEQVAENGDTFMLLKHSATCPISLSAYAEYEKFYQDHPNFKSFYLTVQDARPLSNYIAEKYHIKHESPQAILFVNKDVAWHASHRQITNSTLRKVIEEKQ